MMQPSGPGDTKTTGEEFRLKEYESLRAEIANRLEEMWKFEKFALGGAAAIVGWLITHQREVPHGNYGWWLPFAFVSLCAWRFQTGMTHITERLAKYIRTVEASYLGPAGGWETWFASQSQNETNAYLVLWSAALILTFCVPLIDFGSAPTVCPMQVPTAVHPKG